MYDLLISGGTIVDGSGDPPFTGDVAVVGGSIVAVSRGASLGGEAARRIDATGQLVTPGFVDVHTHYDGQVTWDDRLDPSASHGVTTIVMGNCGVGFAPVRPGSEDWLIQLMEGVEDIPGTALSEGMTWGWESFPEYLDVLEEKRWSVDVATQIAHGAIRGYVMGERGARNEPATPEDIEAMARIVQEAIESGALGVSTSRVLGHRAMDGEPVPGTFAAEDELFGMGRALARGGGGVFELAPAGVDGQDLIRATTEMAWMTRLSAEIGQPVSYALLQIAARPQLYRELMDEALEATSRGANVVALVAGRPFGMLIGLQSHHAFAKRPTFTSLAHLPLDELVAQLARPEVRAAILSEQDLPTDPTILYDGLSSVVQHMLGTLFPMEEPLDYEPTAADSVAGLAAARDLDPLELLYDLQLENGGRSFFMMPLLNYAETNHDALYNQLMHPTSVLGLGDGGAHCGMICDASIPTYLLTHWARDRQRGPRIPVETVIRKQTSATAELYGLTDRGLVAPGKRADLNVIDHGALTLHAPVMAHDLPAGGRRLLQGSSGYHATIANGTITRWNDQDTGARPGRLIRGPQ